uniref:RxLR effector protein n=1 Tax=Phytophthora agathidicida TaxID=1642459 RepID=A0A7G4WI42_9STRA|nr:PaRXLR53 [Phytophthora agathidicida]
MRLSCALLIAAATATLLTSGSAAAASGHSTEVLAVASPELTGVGQAVGGAKRSLRYHDNDDRADEEEDEENDDEEERAGGANIYATKKLDQMLASVKRAQNGDDGGMKKVYQRFERWKRYGYNAYHPPAALDNDKYLKLRQAYRSWAY